MAIDASSLPAVDPDSYDRYRSKQLNDFADTALQQAVAPAPTPAPPSPEPTPQPSPEPAATPVPTTPDAQGGEPAPTPVSDATAPAPEAAPPTAAPTTGQPVAPTPSPKDVAAAPAWLPDSARSVLGLPTGHQAPQGGTSLTAIYQQNAGKPYLWGSAGGRSDFGPDPRGFDCSGFVAYALNRASGGAVKVPAYTDAIASSGSVTQTDTPQPGYVVLYRFHDPGQPGVQYPHTAIYIGGGKVMQSGGNASDVNIAPIDQLPGATFWRPKNADAINLGDLAHPPAPGDRPVPMPAPTPTPTPGNLDLPPVDVDSANAHQSSSLQQFASDRLTQALGVVKDAVGQVTSGAASVPAAVEQAPQSLQEWVQGRLAEIGKSAESNAAAATGPQGEMAGGALGVGRGTAAQQAEPAHALTDAIPNVTGFDPNVPIDQQSPSAAPPGTVASRMPLPAWEAGPPSPEQLQTQQLTNPDLSTAQGIHGFSSALGEGAGGSIHAILPQAIKNLPVLQGAMEQVLNPEFAPGSAPGMLVGEAMSFGLKAVRPAVQMAAPAIDALLKQRGVDLSMLGPSVKDGALAGIASDLMDRGVDLSTLGNISDVQLGKVVGNALAAVDATAKENGVTTGQLAAHAGIGAGLGMASARQVDPNAGPGDLTAAAIVGALFGGGSAMRGATIGAGVKAVAGADAVRAADPGLAKVIEGFNGQRPTQTASELWRGFTQNLERWMVDEQAPLNNLGTPQEAAVSTYKGRAGMAAQKIEDGLGPVYETLGATQGRNEALLQQFDAYVGLQNYIERATAKGGGIRNGPGGVSNVADAKDYINRLQAQLGPTDWARIQTADAQRQAAMHDMLMAKVNAGFITKKTAADLERTYPHYNPVTVLLALEDAGAGPVSGAKLTQLGNTIKRLSDEGSPADQLSAMQSAVLSLGQGYTNVARNDTVKTVLDFFKNQVKEDGTPLIPIKQVELRTGPDVNNAPDLATIVQGIRGEPRGTVSFWKGGVRQVADMRAVPDIERAMKSLDSTQLHPVLQLAQILNAPLRYGATTLSVPFQLRNAVFDAVDAYVRAGIKPNQIVRGYIDAATNSPAFREYVANGGSMGGFSMQESPLAKILNRQTDPAKAAAQLEKTVRASGGTLIQTPGDYLRVAKKLGLDTITFQPVRRIGEIIESGPRMARFNQAIAKGLSPQEAAMHGRRVTVDFSRMGSVMRGINALIPFSNAALQGSLNIGRSMRDTPAARLRLATLTGVTASTYAWNNQNPEYTERYQDIPEYLRANSLVMLLPGGERNPAGTPGWKVNPYIALPLRELGTLSYLITKGIDQAMGKPVDWGQSIGQATANMSPVAGEPAAAGILGAPGKEFLQQSSGTGGFDYFRNRPIVSESLQGKQPGSQSTLRTSQSAIDMAAAFNRSPLQGMPVIGGDKSPVRVERAIEDLTGGLGKTVMGASDTLQGKPADTPLLAGHVLSGIVKNYGGETEQRLYQQRDSRLAQITAQNRDLLESLDQNGASIGDPPESVGKIKLSPPEQAEYRSYQVEFLHDLFSPGAGIDEAMKSFDSKDPEDVAARTRLLKRFVEKSHAFAKARTLETMSDDLGDRVEASLNPEQRSPWPQAEYVPLEGKR